MLEPRVLFTHVIDVSVATLVCVVGAADVEWCKAWPLCTPTHHAWSRSRWPPPEVGSQGQEPNCWPHTVCCCVRYVLVCVLLCDIVASAGVHVEIRVCSRVHYVVAYRDCVALNVVRYLSQCYRCVCVVVGVKLSMCYGVACGS